MKGQGLSQNARIEIIRNIIKNFDLDNYLDEFKYNEYTVEVVLDKKKPETRTVRDRLLKYMKSDVIRINDLNYMQELKQSIDDSKKAKQLKQMESLEELEKKRERKLKAIGLIEKTLEDETKEKQANRTKSMSYSYDSYSTLKQDAKISFRLPKLISN